MYKKMYSILFNAFTDALELLEKGNVWDAKRVLMDAQCAAEEVYISAGEGADAPCVIEIFGNDEGAQ